ncbi:MAG: sugar phosphate isomerase/epimerase [Armatimonadetes bacterium]|nr:sugar phosphate isomerase/epimerase [Armatimonadota bacterium]
MRLAISMWSYFRAWKQDRIDLTGFVIEAKQVGAEGVELLDFFYKDRAEDRQLLKSILNNEGFPCPIFSVSPNFAKADAAERIAEMDTILRGLEDAVELGASTLRVFAGNPADGVSYDSALGWIVDNLSEASRRADSAGVTLSLENHGKLAGRSSQVSEIIEAVRKNSGNNALGANPDTANFMLVGEDSASAVAAVAKYAYMCHLKDFKLAEPGWEGFAYEGAEGKKYVGTALGEGDVDLPACLQALQAQGYQGWLSLEYEGEEDPMTAVPRSIQFARSLLGSTVS